MRFACGTSGYNLLVKHGQPLPSNRTLQRQIQTIDFQPEILNCIMLLLNVKMQDAPQDEKFCCLTFDEMAIKPGLQYDVSDQVIRGFPTHK